MSMKKLKVSLLPLSILLGFAIAIGIASNNMQTAKAAKSSPPCLYYPNQLPGCNGIVFDTYGDYADWYAARQIDSTLGHLTGGSGPCLQYPDPQPGCNGIVFDTYGQYAIWYALRQIDSVAGGGGGGGNIVDSIKKYAWLLKGNTLGSNPDFLGTIDNTALTIRIDSVLAGRIGNTNQNTWLGYKAGFNTAVATGGNTFYGWMANGTYSAGTNNTALGNEAGFANAGSYNTFCGEFSGAGQYSGNQNTCLGASSGTAGPNTNFNFTSVGYSAKGWGSNMVQLGNTSVDSVSTYGVFNINLTPITDTGITACMPFQGRAYKKVVIYITTSSAASTYKFPKAFTNVPLVVSNATLAPMVTNLTITQVRIINTSATAGYLFLEGN